MTNFVKRNSSYSKALLGSCFFFDKKFDKTKILFSLLQGGSACVAAAFLSQFTSCENYIHIDMAPTKIISSDLGYMSRGMSGGPVLSLLEFIEKLYS